MCVVRAAPDDDACCAVCCQALRYCEVIATRVCQQPTAFSATLVRQLAELGERLKYHDAERRHSAEELPDPAWLVNIHALDAHFRSGHIAHVPPQTAAVAVAPSLVNAAAAAAGTPPIVTSASDTRASSEVAEITQGIVTQGEGRLAKIMALRSFLAKPSSFNHFRLKVAVIFYMKTCVEYTRGKKQFGFYGQQCVLYEFIMNYTSTSYGWITSP